MQTPLKIIGILNGLSAVIGRACPAALDVGMAFEIGQLGVFCGFSLFKGRNNAKLGIVCGVSFGAVFLDLHKNHPDVILSLNPLIKRGFCVIILRLKKDFLFAGMLSTGLEKAIRIKMFHVKHFVCFVTPLRLRRYS